MGSEKKQSSTNFVFRLIQNHYSVSPPNKSEAQMEREKWLVPKCLKFNRWACMPAAFVIQFCCGSLYSWSVFNKPIDDLIYGKNLNMAPITFYIAVGFLGFAAAVMGPWLERHGPFVTCALGSSLFYTGNLITALAIHLRLIWLVFIGYGIVAGFGLGVCYISPVSALLKWFPDRRGLAAGFAVCGFGAGSIVISKVQLPLVHLVGLPLTFLTLGSIYFTCMIICATVLRTPPPTYTVTLGTQPAASFKYKPGNADITTNISQLTSNPKLNGHYTVDPVVEANTVRTADPKINSTTADLQLNTHTADTKINTHTVDPKINGHTADPKLNCHTTDQKINGYTADPKIHSHTADSKTNSYKADPTSNGEYQEIELEDIPNGQRSMNQITETQSMTLIEAISSTDFRFLMLMFTSTIVFGLVLVSRLSNIITDIFGKTADEASTVVAINGGFNLCGRMAISVISDYVGRKNCFLVLLSLQVIILGCFSSMTNNGAYLTFVISMWIVTACYGAAFGTVPALLSDKFGPSNIGACHGIVLTGWSFAGIAGGLIFTSVFNAVLPVNYIPANPYPYNVNVWWIFGIVCVGWVALFFMRPTVLDQKFNGRFKRIFKCSYKKGST